VNTNRKGEDNLERHLSNDDKSGPRWDEDRRSQALFTTAYCP
jgi:hypothetical protein